MKINVVDPATPLAVDTANAAVGADGVVVDVTVTLTVFDGCDSPAELYAVM